MTDRQTTHAQGCWDWGPRHYECALREIEALRKEVERLKSMPAVTMGVGSGDGNLFVHGDCESIKAAQAIVLERGALRAEVERLNQTLGRIVEGNRPMTTEAVVEAVARAICVACDEDPDRRGDARGNDFRWQDYRDAALAALAAISARNDRIERATLQDEALLRQALEALELRCGANAEERKELIPALRERLAEKA